MMWKEEEGMMADDAAGLVIISGSLVCLFLLFCFLCLPACTCLNLRVLGRQGRVRLLGNQDCLGRDEGWGGAILAAYALLCF